MYPGSLTVFSARPEGWKPSTRPITIVEYQNCLYVQHPEYGLRVYSHPIDGWNIGFEYEPTDDLFSDLIFGKTVWADGAMRRAWDEAWRKHKGLWKPVKQGHDKPGPRDHFKKESIYVPLEG